MKLQIIIAMLPAFLMTAPVLQAAPKKVTTTKKTEIILTKVSGQVNWTGYGVGKSHSGTIQVKSGEITLGEKDVPEKMNFILDMKSLDTPDSDKLKGHLRSADFFDVEKYPEATFKSKAATINPGSKDGVAVYTVKGDLTIKDKTAPIEFVVNITKEGLRYSAIANTTISDRTLYGINYNSKKFATLSKLGDKLIEDNIKIDLSVQAQK